MKVLLALGVLVALLAASGGGAATRPFPGSVSWADARHGWAPNWGERSCKPSRARPQGNARVCATEDGGRTWRTIFVGGNYVFTALRTSKSAGIVSTGAHGHVQFWTRDNGRHWYGTEVAGGVGGFNSQGVGFVGRGNRLYWAQGFGDTVHQVTPWPPTGQATCTGKWAHSAFGEEDVHPEGNHCQGPPVEADMRSVPVITGHGRVVRLALVPGGVFAVFERPDAALTAVVRRGDSNLVRDLPAPALPARVSGVVHRLRIDWPEIVVEGRTLSGDLGRESTEVIWRSPDGGASWNVSVRPAWTSGSANPIARAAAAAGVIDGEIVLVGGRFVLFQPGAGSMGDTSRLVQAYRPSDDTWRRLPDLPAAVGYAAGASAGSELYVVGGFDARKRPQRHAFVLRAGAWHRLPAAPEPRAAAGAAIVGDKLYVVGGIGRAGLARATLVLDLRSNRWSRAPAPRPRAFLGVAAAGGRIVALGGRVAGAGTSLALAESWRPGDRRWRLLPPLPSRRSDTAAVAVGDRVVSLGGAVTEYYKPLASAALLEPGAQRWERLPDLRTPRHGLAAAVVGHTIYALVGGDDYAPDDKSVANESLHLEP